MAAKIDNLAVKKTITEVEDEQGVPFMQKRGG
jgi:hypothetical protein